MLVVARRCAPAAFRASRVAGTSRGYTQDVIDHFEKPLNVGSLDKNDPSVGTGLVGAPACGDVMKLQIKVDDDGNIVDAKFKTFGCGSATSRASRDRARARVPPPSPPPPRLQAPPSVQAIASSSVASEWVKGRNIESDAVITNSEIAEHLNLPPVKLHCSMLAEDAINAAIADYRKKQEKEKAAAA